jgi:hypothetical protein
MRIHQTRCAGGHDVDSRAEKLDVAGDRQRIALRSAGRVYDAIGFEADERVGVRGGSQPDGFAIGQFAGVLAVLLR